MRRLPAHTKIVATLGPASEPCIGELIDAGLSVARINFSHGTPEEHRRRVASIRESAKKRGAAVAILADIQGPKLRLGTFAGGDRRLAPGDEIRLKAGEGPAGDGEICFVYPELAEAVRVGERIFLADGAVEVRVESRRGEVLVGSVTRGGVIGDRKGFHLPDTDVALSIPTEKDEADLGLARQLQVDLIGASFISRPEEIQRIRELAPGIGVVAKIERAPAVERIDSILAEADGIMIARGDLGVELDLERVPLVQKYLIERALHAGKFAITATEMLESMVESSRPTRAEVADVAQAVLDGTDAVMLSAETAIGRYPVEAVKTMGRIARTVEESAHYAERSRVDFRTAEPTFPNAVAMSAVRAAAALRLDKIACFTRTGDTARLLSRYRPRATVIALTPEEGTRNALAALAHVLPVRLGARPSLEAMLTAASERILEGGLAEVGEAVVFVAGVPPGAASATNVMMIHRLGEPLSLAK